MITPNMIAAIKVVFKKQIWEEDFPERGMTAWLTGIEWNKRNECYELFFDFKDFEVENDKYFKEVYFPNVHTRELAEKPLYTAKEAGYYNPKYSVFWSASSQNRELCENDFSTAISEFLLEVE